MANKDILQYLRKTPHNTNVNVVKGMIGNNSNSPIEISTIFEGDVTDDSVYIVENDFITNPTPTAVKLKGMVFITVLTYTITTGDLVTDKYIGMLDGNVNSSMAGNIAQFLDGGSYNTPKFSVISSSSQEPQQITSIRITPYMRDTSKPVHVAIYKLDS